MGILEKINGSNYSPIPDDHSDTSTDDLINGGHRSSRSQHKTFTKSWIIITLGSFAALAVYSALLITVTSKVTSSWWKHERIHGANVIDCA
jgi:hypothetical protein